MEGGKRQKIPRKSDIPSKPDIPDPNKHLNPGDDFFNYVNSYWIQHVRMPPFLSSFSVSEEIEDSINNKLLDIIEEAQKNPEKDHTSTLISTYMNSIVDNKLQKNNIQYIKSTLSKIQCIRSVEDVGCVLGDFIQRRIPTFLSIHTSPSDKNYLSNYITFSGGSLGLGSTKYYTEKDFFKRTVFNHYKHLLQTLEKDFEFEGLETFPDIEHKVAPTLYKSFENDDDKEQVLKGSNLLKTYKHIPWESIVFCSMKIDLKTFEKTEYLITNPTWLNYLNILFDKFPITIWKIWLAGNLLVYMLPLLSAPYDNYYFELFGKKMRGQSEKNPKERLGLYMIRKFLSPILGELYVKKFVPFEIKKEATELANEIKHVAEERIGNLEWLKDEAKKEARLKIKSIFLSIAYPDSFDFMTKAFDHVKLNEYSSVENTFLVSSISFLNLIQHAGTSINPRKWRDQVYAVNAYYYNEGNRLILPCGILSWPFFHIKASYGWNYGAIGCVIGHEITHAFDVDGKDYDHKGNKRSWWSKKDNEEYKKRTKSLEKLYSETTYFGKHLDGDLTLSENIADLGGMALSLTALKSILDKKHIEGAERKKQICDFFRSFAVSWRTKDKKKKALQSLFTDPHSPPSVRVNNIISQFDDWYECFDIKPSDKMYVAPKDRIQIF